MSSKITKKQIQNNFLSTELVDIPIKVIEHPDPTVIGIKGTIIEESKNMLKIESDDRVIQISKSHAKFGFVFNGQKLVVSGDLLIGLAKQRSKRKHKNW